MSFLMEDFNYDVQNNMGHKCHNTHASWKEFAFLLNWTSLESHGHRNIKARNLKNHSSTYN